MEENYLLLGIFMLGVSTIYFYICLRRREQFVKYLSLYWALCSCSVFLFYISQITDKFLFDDLRIILDVFGVICLLNIVDAFSGRKVPGMWTRFALYLSLWVLIGAAYNFGQMVLYIPVGVYQIVIIIVIVYDIFMYWRNKTREKIGVSLVLFTWIAGKSVAGFLNIYYGETLREQVFASEMIYINVVNILLFVIYYRNFQNEMEREQSIFKIITENASDVLFLYELKKGGRFTYVSQSVSNMLGISPGKFYSDNRYYKEIVHPEDMSTFEDLISPAADVKKRAMIRIYNRDSVMLWCDVTTVKLPGMGEEDNETVEGIIRDITAIKEANEQLITSKKSRDVLLSYISHELKTPITSILGFASALKDNVINDGRTKNDMINAIYNKSLALDKLIFDLGQLSKLETNQFSFEFSVFDCFELATELEQRHMNDGDSQQIMLDFKLDESRLSGKYVVADLDRLDQVFTNILSNAMRYTPRSKSIKIFFSTDKNDKHMMFSVTNFGPIIKREEIPHIFDRFYRVKRGQQSANENSSGLGLTISKEMMAAHKGSIEVVSNEANGTTFKVLLPIFDEKEYR